jgi:hypothetical protein
MPYRMCDPEQVVAEFLADGQPYAVFVDDNLGSRPDYLRALCRTLARHGPGRLHGRLAARGAARGAGAVVIASV